MDVHRPTIIMLLDYLINVMLLLIDMCDKKKNIIFYITLKHPKQEMLTLEYHHK